jgi:uncharacterized damage-inducible protein DinB
MSRITEIRELVAYTRWANEQMLDAVALLSPDEVVRDLRNSFPSIRDTLVHVLSAEWVWLSRLEGTSPQAMPEAWKPYTRDQIRAEWTRVADRLGRLVAGLADTDVDRVIDYRSTSGQPFSSTVGEILRHLVNHSTYHRGQVTTMLRQLDAKPPTTDLIHYYRTQAARAPLPQ